MTIDTGPTVLEARAVCKQFPGVRALKNVDFNLHAGEVHFLLGENGAGKSTLINIFSGLHVPDSGTILFEGCPVSIDSPIKAQNMGIRTIHQEFMLIPNISVAENIMYGEGIRSVIYNKTSVRASARRILGSLEVNIDPDRKVSELRASEKQIVDIARALAGNVRILIMDEPTSALSSAEIARLFSIIRALKARNVAMIYISHRLEELYEIADRLTILRDGEKIETLAMTGQTEKETIVEKMVGRKLENHYPYMEIPPGNVLLEARKLCRLPDYSGVSLTVRQGEILGVTGVLGSGMESVAYTLTGLLSPDDGMILRDGRPIRLTSPRAAMEQGIGLIPGDRREMGLVINFPVGHNITLASLEKISAAGIIHEKREHDLVDNLIKTLGIVTPKSDTATHTLSGGNQQKVVIAKWVARQVDVLISVEPTRGIDVAARVDIYQLFNEMARSGKAVIIFSTDYSEILGVCSRITAMRNGTVVREYKKDEVSRQDLLKTIFGAQSA